MKPLPVNMSMEQMLLQTKLFTSKSDLRRAVEQKGVKVNRVRVELTDLDQLLEVGDFLNFVWLPSSVALLEQFGPNLLTVHRGKNAALVQVTDTVKVLT